MSDKDYPEELDGKMQEIRLAHALVSRGLISKEESDSVHPGEGEELGAKKILKRLRSAELLTQGQARRAYAELETFLGQQIPGFFLQEKVGQGSMGTVYRALQVSMNRTVAVKILNPRWAARKDLLESLEREAQVAARLSHNNIVQAIDVGHAGKIHYMVMEFMEGKTIRQEFDAGKRYQEKEALEIIVQIAQALSHAHRRGLIHRDVKPANIVLTTDGIAKLADLGMARHMTDEMAIRKERGLAIGTPYYMAPEQARARDDVDGRADIYSLGATLYHMTTGVPPYQGKDAETVIRAHLEGDLTPPDHLNRELSSGLGEVVEIMMARDRRNRYANADDLIIDLECLIAGEPPKLAHKKIQASTLQGLAEGEDDEEAGSSGKVRVEYLYILGGLLLFSMLFNLLLLLRTRS